MEITLFSATSNDCPDGARSNRKDRKLRVLVVEDDTDTAESTALLLGLYGHLVQVAGDGPSALLSAQADPPDVVLLDLGLPGGMNGWEVAQRLQEQATLKKPFLIAISGYGRASDRYRSAEAGIDLHFTKPVNPDELQGVLKRFQAIILPGEEASQSEVEERGHKQPERAGACLH